MRILHTGIELFTAALAQVRVTVRERDGQIADYGGAIEKYTPVRVKIGGVYYSRDFHVFTRKINI